MDAFSAWVKGLLPTDLPPPPAPQPPGELSGWQILLVVVIVVGTVLLIAMALKPIVLGRLQEEEGQPPETALSEVPPQPPGAEREGVPLPEPEPVEWKPKLKPAVEPAAPAERVTISTAIDAETVAAIAGTVRELLASANAGRLLRGFALYSEDHLQRFRAETGLTEEEFTAIFATVPPPPPEARVELDAVSAVERLPDGRVRAVVTYRQMGAVPPPPERYTFVRAASGDRWLIDEITTVEPVARRGG